jgi:hypothetical protein
MCSDPYPSLCCRPVALKCVPVLSDPCHVIILLSKSKYKFLLFYFASNLSFKSLKLSSDDVVHTEKLHNSHIHIICSRDLTEYTDELLVATCFM